MCVRNVNRAQFLSLSFSLRVCQLEFTHLCLMIALHFVCICIYVIIMLTLFFRFAIIQKNAETLRTLKLIISVGETKIITAVVQIDGMYTSRASFIILLCCLFQCCIGLSWPEQMHRIQIFSQCCNAAFYACAQASVCAYVNSKRNCSIH